MMVVESGSPNVRVSTSRHNQQGSVALPTLPQTRLHHSTSHHSSTSRHQNNGRQCEQSRGCPIDIHGALDAVSVPSYRVLYNLQFDVPDKGLPRRHPVEWGKGDRVVAPSYYPDMTSWSALPWPADPVQRAEDWRLHWFVLPRFAGAKPTKQAKSPFGSTPCV